MVNVTTKVSTPDFSALEGFNLDALGSKGDMQGQVSRAPRLKFIADPQQPRKKFDSLDSLAASLKAEGMKHPIIVGSPNEAGLMMIKDGERRWRASALVDLAELPYVIDDEFDKLTQLIVNMQREDNTADERAATVVELEKLGIKRAEIARRMGKSPAFVTELAEFAKMPAVLRALYDQGRCTNVTVLNLLARLFKKHPEAVQVLIANPLVDINRRVVNELSISIHQLLAEPEGETEAESSPNFEAETNSDDLPSAEAGHSSSAQAQTSAAPAGVGDRFKRPVIHVIWRGKPAVLLINKRCEAGKAWIKLASNGAEKEVAFSAVQNVEIKEAS
jgi:ParB family transcriptional regulator, chromosome partitioning protein